MFSLKQKKLVLSEAFFRERVNLKKNSYQIYTIGPTWLEIHNFTLFQAHRIILIKKWVETGSMLILK